MKEDQYKILLEEVRGLRDQVSDTNFAVEKLEERQQDLILRLENVESELKQNRTATNSSSERIKNKVADVVEPVIKATENLTAQIKKSKKVVIRDKKGIIETVLGR